MRFYIKEADEFERSWLLLADIYIQVTIMYAVRLL